MLVTKIRLREEIRRTLSNSHYFNLEIPGILSVPSANLRKIAHLLCRPWSYLTFGFAENNEIPDFSEIRYKGQI
jgi:hypothetical protein